MKNLSKKSLLAILAATLCVGASVSVLAQERQRVAQVPPPALFDAKPGSARDTDCIIPKAAGALKSTSVEVDQGGTNVWTTYEDASGSIRVYRLYHPSSDMSQAGAIAGMLGGVNPIKNVGPAGSQCGYIFKIARQ
jgi:hypothetical protein